MKYKSLQKKTWKLLLCFQLLKQNTSYRITVLRKKKLNIIIYASGQKNFPCLKFYFFFPGNGKDLKTSLNQKKTTTKKDRTCILSRCSDTNFMQTGNLFFCGAEIRKQKCFWATRDNRKWKYLFFLSIYLQANKFVFTKCLYSYHETRFAWKFGQNHCPRIKQSPLPVECDAQTLGFVPGFVSAPHCDLNVTRVKIEFYQKNQAEIHFEARGTTRSGCWGWSSCFEKENHRKAMT